MTRYNGTFKYRNSQDPVLDEATGFYQAPESSGEWVDGGHCQIDRSTDRILQGEDGRVYSTIFTVFVPRPFKGSLAIGTEIQITMEDGSEDQFTVERIDNQNRRYIEIGN